MTFELKRRENPPDMIRWQMIGEAVEKILGKTDNCTQVQISRSVIFNMDHPKEILFSVGGVHGKPVCINPNILKALDLMVEEL